MIVEIHFKNSSLLTFSIFLSSLISFSFNRVKIRTTFLFFQVILTTAHSYPLPSGGWAKGTPDRSPRRWFNSYIWCFDTTTGFLQKYINKSFCWFSLPVNCTFEITLKANPFTSPLEVDKKIMNRASFYVSLYNKPFHISVF